MYLLIILLVSSTMVETCYESPEWSVKQTSCIFRVLAVLNTEWIPDFSIAAFLKSPENSNQKSSSFLLRAP